MTTDSVREKITQVIQTIVRIKDEVEEIYKEGKRRAREKSSQKKNLEEAQKNFSIERPEEGSANDYH